ncbi:F0F1 ATP synthase subunit epsilon [Alloscardovia theropitheci]|uniref:F0F1 ATP synthase subunit epsilon n=1 Tax=Alloscardovia theropitheci TaxID=2496842 RepID=A0A4V2MTW6_9BIFI|nr:F0F1 ATP synthase subunit epsilon [Alloscardovia theropitheci]TCD54089.1 F0F1 ATP synthase subunit epsilon [Alloscardovia theropitheci]
MAGEKRIIDVNVVAEDRPLWSGRASSVVVPTLEGYMGILADHEPILALVGEGNVQITTEDESRKAFKVVGGFVSFENNSLTIGVDKCLGNDDENEQ